MKSKDTQLQFAAVKLPKCLERPHNSTKNSLIILGEIEKFIIRQPPIGEKDDYDSENSWISDGLSSSSRRRRRGGGRWEVGEWREK